MRTCKDCRLYKACVKNHEYLLKISGNDLRNQLEKEITTDDLLGEYACFTPKVVMCDVCTLNSKNGGDCNRTLPITSRDNITETNVTEYIKLEFCSKGVRE